LADADSLFVTVEGVSLHYKEALPGALSLVTAGASTQQAGSSSGSGSSSSAADGGVSGNGDPAAWRRRPTVLLLHGFNGSVFNWRDTMQAVADQTGCRWVWPERRNCEQSSSGGWVVWPWARVCKTFGEALRAAYLCV
jgi:pimeloyl-ACP methyl ester carboxylesterase